ncbi:MAG: tRNA 2-thiouridine(34) synthase MnmA [Pseudomonadota bacterium]
MMSQTHPHASAREDLGLMLVGLSGGVDSAVAALCLLHQGYRVEGLFMKNWEEDDQPGYCAAAKDLATAEAVAKHLDIPLYRINFAADYWEGVFETFLAEYRAGRTPNPDVLCNREIKFKAFLDHALDLGATAIATGHYADIVQDENGYHLWSAADTNKDQTYFLHLLDQRALAHSRFPLAHLTKTEVRDLASAAGLPNHARKDSTGLCFIGERRFDSFLARFLEPQPGPIETPEGKCLGEHRGLMFHTLGQRHGLGLGGRHGGLEAPWYVAAKVLSRNALVVVQGHDHPLLFHRGLVASHLHWVSGRSPAIMPLFCQARLRHRQPLQDCHVVVWDDELTCQVSFNIPQRAVAPGQAVVFYHCGECLGGATIERAID